MKKNYFKIVASAALVLLFASCQLNENDFEGSTGVIGKNTVAFSVGGANTRSSVVLSDISEPGAIIPLGTDESGTNFYLEESVIDLNSPVTRGTPAYTENVVALYNKKMFVHSALGDKDVYEYDEGSKCYIKSYGENIWKNGSTLKFWMYMPSDLAESEYITTENESDPKFTFGGESSGAQTISFSYESPESAADQADIIFSARSITESEYDGNNKVMDVLFHHALTGVKFRIGNDEGEDGDIAEYGISINSISFTGLYDTGDCVVTPTKEGTGDNAKYQDITTEYSSQAEGVVVWDNLDVSDPEKTISSGDYGDLVTYKSGEGSFKTEGYKYPASFSAKSNDKNLNDDDATQTFWLIPQTIRKGVVLTINYTVDGNDYTWDIDFGTALEGVVWKPGQLRTFTIRIDEVNVQIDDEVEMEEATTQHYETEWGEEFDLVSYKDSKKTGVTITNTGNTDAYIRAAIIGQWLDENDNPVFGFTDYTHGIQLVDSWYQDQFGENAQHIHGEFEGLVGYDSSYSGDWVLGDDGYYYYTKIVKAGESIPNNDPLFISYTVGDTPGTAVAGAAKNVYFVLEIATQAISAKKLDGSSYSYTEAWANAYDQE